MIRTILCSIFLVTLAGCLSTQQQLVNVDRFLADARNGQERAMVVFRSDIIRKEGDWMGAIRGLSSKEAAFVLRKRILEIPMSVDLSEFNEDGLSGTVKLSRGAFGGWWIHNEFTTKNGTSKSNSFRSGSPETLSSVLSENDWNYEFQIYFINLNKGYPSKSSLTTPEATPPSS